MRFLLAALALLLSLSTYAVDGWDVSDVIPPKSSKRRASYDSGDVSVRRYYSGGYNPLAVTVGPSLGATTYTGYTGGYISNDYTVGLAIDVPITSSWSVEPEAQYGDFRNRSTPAAGTYSTLGVGANGKYYLAKASLRPYVGGGLAGVRYENLGYYRESEWLGAGSVMLGTDIGISTNVAIGLRGTYTQPIFQVSPRYWGSLATVLDNAYYRLGGSVTVGL